MAIIEELPDDYQKDVAVQSVLDETEVIRKSGNDHFGRGEWTEAKECYQKALDLLAPPTSAEKSEAEETPVSDSNGNGATDSMESPEVSRARAILLSNMAAVFIKMEQWDAAVTCATQAIDSGACPNEKALERRAFAYSHDGKPDEALKDYQQLCKDFPQRVHYFQKATELEKRIDERNEELKKEMMQKLKGLGDFCLRPFGLSTDSFQLTPNGSGGYSINMKSSNSSAQNDNESQ